MFDNWNILFWEYEFLSPNWLWGLLLVPLVLIRLFKNERNKTGEFKFSRSNEDQEELATDWISQIRWLIIISNGIVLTFLIVALAKPLDRNSNENLDEDYKNGIDIVLAMDVSGSMLTRDFEPNRLEVSKLVAKEFVAGRRGDRIGLVLFAGEAYTACPPTLDHTILKNQIDVISGDSLKQECTSIGTGLGTAISRIKDDSLSSKVIILLTDGTNNYGDVSPEVAADIAKAKNIRVYTIGVGSYGEALTPIETIFGVRYQNVPVEIDEQTLKNIAKKTEGKYFRAANVEGLKSIYKEIEKLEKNKMLDQQYQKESPATPSAFLKWAFLLIIITWIFKLILFKSDE